MSLIVAIKTPNEIVVCSDGLGLRLEANHPIIYSGAKKVFRILDQTIVFAYTGVASIGDLALQFVTAKMSSGGNPDCIVHQCASFIAGLNDGFAETEDAKVISSNGFSPLTGVLLAGYIDNKQLLSIILPTGKILTPNHYAVLGYSANFVSNFLKENVGDNLDTSAALRLGKAAILKASEFSFSNNEIYCVSVSFNQFITL